MNYSIVLYNLVYYINILNTFVIMIIVMARFAGTSRT